VTDEDIVNLRNEVEELVRKVLLTHHVIDPEDSRAEARTIANEVYKRVRLFVMEEEECL
jgi:hypothetical protein